MEDRSRGDSDADFELARRAVDLGWLTREQVEVALLEVERAPASRLLSHLPLTPDQLHRLEAPAPALPPELVKAAADPARRVAQYVLSEDRRTGGMGTVVKAWDTRLLRWVALKFLKKVGGDRRRAGFEEEARLAAGLSHPNIAAVYEIGEHDGAPFIAMQFIDGRTLAEARRGMKPREAARIVRDAAQAVAFAHEHGIVHRDLKPSNAMLDGSGRVFVMDFGLATQTEVLGTRRYPGRSRTISGTPEYVSPEQARGEEADERTDVHGLGATLYDLLTGRPPNPGKSIPEILEKLKSSSRVAPRELNRRIEPDLETIVLTCLERDASRRYPSANALAEDLDRFLNRDPITARRPSLVYRLRMKLAKRKAAVAAAVTAAVLAAALGWWVLVGSPATEHTRLYAEAMNLWAETLRSAGVGGDPDGIRRRARAAREAFEQANQVREEAPAHLMRGKCLQLEGRQDEALKALERAHELGPGSVEARVELAKVLFMAYRVSRGLPAVFKSPGIGDRKGRLDIGILPAETMEQRRWREEGESLLTPGDSTPSQKNLMRAFLSMGKGNLAEAADAFEAYWKEERWDASVLTLQGICRLYAKNLPGAVAAFDRSLDRVRNASDFLWRGFAKEWMSLYDEAIADYSRSIELDPGNSNAYSRRGAARRVKGLLDEAIADLSKAIELDPRNAGAFSGRGTVKASKGLFDEAIADQTRAIELDPKNAAIPYFNRGNDRRLKGLVEEAIADFAKAVEADPSFAMAWYALGNARAKAGGHDRAIADFTRAIEAEPTYAEAYNDRGIAKMRLGLNDEAMADFQMAIALDPLLAKAYVNLGAMKATTGSPDEGLADIEKAIAMDPKLASSYHSRGSVKRAKGLVDEALADFDKAIELDPKDPEAYISRGALMNDIKGLPDRAIPDFNKAIELDPKSAKAYNNRGAAKSTQSQFDEAIADLSKAIELDPKMVIAYRNRGYAKSSKGLHKEAMEDFNSAIRLNPRDPEAYVGRGTSMFDLGRNDEAIADCTKAIELNSKCVRAFNIRGSVKCAKGLLDEAIEDFNSVLQLNPTSADAYGNRGIANSRRGRYDEAAADYRKALEVAKPGWRFRAMIQERLDTLEVDRPFQEARGLLQAKQYRKAIEKFQAVVEHHPQDRQVVPSAYNIACAYALLGEKSNALDWLERAVEMGWKDLAHIERDSDLDSLRGEERFKKLVARLKSK